MAARAQSQKNPKQPARIGNGWVAFAGTYLTIAGVLNLIWGITAFAKKDYFASELIWNQLEAWGSIALVVGAIQVVTGALLFTRKIAGTLMAIVIAMSGMLINFLSIGAYPAWSVVAIVCNALVLWAVTVHSDEF